MEGSTLRYLTSPQDNDQLQNEAAMIVAEGTNRVYGDVLNRIPGSIILSGNSQTTFYDDVENEGIINVATGSTATFFGEVSGNGVGGAGTVFMEGDVTPGFSAGVMEYGGDVHLGDFSTLAIEIDGPSHDMLDVAGEISLGGELLLDAISALDDASLTIVSADSIVGEFDDEPELYSHIGSGMFLTGISYTDQAVIVTVEQGFADFNTDGFVNKADLSLWEAGYGIASGAGLTDGDANGDGQVNGQDFLIWEQKANQSSVNPLASASTVPEPTALALLAWSMALVGSVRFRC